MDRNITEASHDGSGDDFFTIGEVFTSPSNAGRKRTFSTRFLIEAISDLRGLSD